MPEGVQDALAKDQVWIEELLERWGALPLATRLYGLMLWWRFGAQGQECRESREALAGVAGTSERYVRRMEQQLEALGLVIRSTTPRGRTLSFAAGWREVQAYRGTGVPRYRRTAVQAYLPPKEEAEKPLSALPAPRGKGPAWYRTALAWPLPADLDQPQVRQAWEGWVESRRLKGAKGAMGARACELAVSKLQDWGPELGVEALDRSTVNGWTGLFDPRDNPWAKDKGQGEDALAEYDRNKKTERYLQRLRREG